MPIDRLRCEVGTRIDDQGNFPTRLRKFGKPVILDAIYGLIGAKIDVLALGIDLLFGQLGEGRIATCMRVPSINGVDGTVPLSFVAGLLGPRAVHNICRNVRLVVAEVQLHSGELSVATAMREKYLVVVRYIHDPSSRRGDMVEYIQELRRPVR